MGESSALGEMERLVQSCEGVIEGRGETLIESIRTHTYK